MDGYLIHPISSSANRRSTRRIANIRLVVVQGMFNLDRSPPASSPFKRDRRSILVQLGTYRYDTKRDSDRGDSRFNSKTYHSVEIVSFLARKRRTSQAGSSNISGGLICASEPRRRFRRPQVFLFPTSLARLSLREPRKEPLERDAPPSPVTSGGR